MPCSNCGFDNPQGSIYCQQCGSRIPGHAAGAPDPAPAPAAPANFDPPGAGAQPPAPAPRGDRMCSRCGSENQPGMRFCVECGNPLSQPTPAGPVQPVSQPPPAGPNAEAPPAGSPGQVPRAEGQAAAEARLVAVLKDGSDGRVFPLMGQQVDIGRSEGDITLPDDPYLSPRHARVSKGPEGWILRDLDSVNGIFVRIREPVDLGDGDMLLIGQQVLRFETLPEGELPLGPASLQGVLAFGTPEVPRVARLVQYTTEGVGRDVHYLYRDETVLGRENGDIVFTDDPFLSRRHAAISVDRGARRFVLKDLGSSNGTAIRRNGGHRLVDGDQFRVGRHLFRFDGSGGRDSQ